MRIAELLNKKGREVRVIQPTATILEAVQTMADADIGSLMVIDAKGSVKGIVTERDCIRIVAQAAVDISKMTVSDVTTRDIVVAEPEDSLDTIMKAMAKHRCRHIPVMDDGELVGLVSVRDVIGARLAETGSELKFLLDYVSS
jgi:CBS domain-containing protein